MLAGRRSPLPCTLGSATFESWLPTRHETPPLPPRQFARDFYRVTLLQRLALLPVLSLLVFFLFAFVLLCNGAFFNQVLGLTRTALYFDRAYVSRSSLNGGALFPSVGSLN